MPSPQLPESQASLAARLPSELLLTGLATTSDAVVVVSPQSRVVLYNAAAEELFGYPADEALGEPFEQLGNEIARQLVALGSSNGGSAAPAGGPGRASLLTGTRKDGSRFEATARLAPVATPDGVFRLLSLRPRVSPSAVAELSLLKAIAIAIGASEDLPAALELTLQQIGDFAGCAAGESWIPDPAGDTLLRGPVWARGGEELLSFHRASKSFTFQRGQGCRAGPGSPPRP